MGNDSDEIGSSFFLNPDDIADETGLNERVEQTPEAPHHDVERIRALMAHNVYSVLDNRRGIENIYSDINCLSETGALDAVIIGFPDNMVLGGLREIICSTMARSAEQGLAPTPAETIAEFTEFKRLLEEHGVKVFMPTFMDVQEQIYSRDIGFVIGDTFFVSGMAKAVRRPEIHGIRHMIPDFPHVVQIPEGIFIEGGDVIVDKGVVYIGVGQRTNDRAIGFMRGALEDTGLQVEPVYIKQPHEGEDSLHLDCTFMPVGDGYALVYEGGMRSVPQPMRDNYTWIPVTREEQENLGTNVLSLSPSRVISRGPAVRLNDEMRRVGIEVIEMKFDQAPMNGGSFRCCSLPLKRR